MEEPKLSDKYKKDEGQGTGNNTTPNANEIVAPQPNQKVLQANQNIHPQNLQQNTAQTSQNNLSSQFKSPVKKPLYGNASSREALIKLMAGETGSGKTVQIIKECQAYVTPNIATGKKARPVFIVHPNVLYEPQYMNTFKHHIRKEQAPHVTEPVVYIILPINPDGSLMNDEQKREMVIFIVNNCKRALVVLDDIDDIFKGAKPRDMDKLFVSYRHLSLDLITTHQFLNPITTQEWGAVTTISLRKTVQSVSIISDRVPNAEILYIAEMMVNEQYNLAHTKFRNGEISEEEFKYRKSFVVDVNIRTNMITGGYSKQCFIRNCKKYLNLNSRKIADFQKVNCDGNGKPLYQRDKAIEKIILDDLWRYYNGRE